MSSKKIGKGNSHPNIALIKYWGKKDIKLNIPTNTSVSLTLKSLKTVTEVSFSKEEAFILDGTVHDISQRMKMMMDCFKERAGNYSNIKIVSNSNFPSSCGLASSASGLSALAKALNDLYELNLSENELSSISRIGSGSSCRSIYNGFTYWKEETVVKFSDWDEIRVFAIILENIKKKVGSTEGMMRTVQTSNLYKFRMQEIEKKAEKAIGLIKEKNFEELAVITMKESNEFHSICLDTYPPIKYLSDHSFEIIEKCHEFNRINGVKLAYTFDAGPNPFILVLNDNFEKVFKYFKDELYEIIVAK